MANDEHVEVVRAGAKAIEEWRAAHPDEGLDLQEAFLIAANLSGATLRVADLSGAFLIEANLSGANLSEVVGLEVSQLARASIDDVTRLPPQIERLRQEIEEAHRAYEEERARERDD